MANRPMLAFAAIVATLALAACGTTETPTDSAGASAAGGDVITVTDARGEAVEVPAGATDVVALEWVAVEHLMTVGIDPAGVADIGGYNDWAGTGAPLSGEPVDVGLRNSPSIDAISGLAPDLIVTVIEQDSAIVEDLEAIAPVVLLQGSDTADPIGTMEADLRLVAQAVGKDEAADAAINDFRTRLADIKANVERGDAAGTSLVQLDGYENGGQIELRPYADGALLPAIFEEIGFTNAWEGKGDPQYGLALTDVEALTALPDDAHIVYMSVGERDIFTQELASNAIWKGLPAVEAGNVHRLPDGIWLFGGVGSMTAYADAVAAVFSPSP